jgi:hypothetical protein
VAKNCPLLKSGWRVVNANGLAIFGEAIDFTAEFWRPLKPMKISG